MMTPDALAQEITAFEKQLPALRKKLGSKWAVIVGSDCKGGFTDFGSAATFAAKNYPNDQFLIRHTDERQVQIPFVAVED